MNPPRLSSVEEKGSGAAGTPLRGKLTPAGARP